MNDRLVAHIVWDWNGTIFNDSVALIQATIDAFAALGLPEVTVALYQQHHTQPIPLFYERLAGRTLSDSEQSALDAGFRRAYASYRPSSELTHDAKSALSTWASLGGSQSLLSMYPREELISLVRGMGIGSFFSRIDAPLMAGQPNKAPYLREHLRALALPEERVLLVGDSVDDVNAARELGIPCLAYHADAAALHSRDHLTGLGVPVVGSLMEAVAVASTPGALSCQS